MNQESKNKQTLKGKIVSDAMSKTVVVEVSRFVMHPKYKKYFRRTKKYSAHVDVGEYKVGDRVVIESHRPISRTKKWVVKEKIS